MPAMLPWSIPGIGAADAAIPAIGWLPAEPPMSMLPMSIGATWPGRSVSGRGVPRSAPGVVAGIPMSAMVNCGRGRCGGSGNGGRPSRVASVMRAKPCRPMDFAQDLVLLVGRGLNDDVQRLRGRDAELVHRDRLHVVAVRLHDGHPQARDAHILVGHGRGVDEAQPHALAGAEQRGDSCGRAIDR